MKRTDDCAFFSCPVCGKMPKVGYYASDFAMAHCTGYALHRHKKVYAEAICDIPDQLVEELARAWNRIGFRQSRFIFDSEQSTKRLDGYADLGACGCKQKHGYWMSESIGAYHKCSACGWYTGQMDEDSADRYCSHCGARMEADP